LPRRDRLADDFTTRLGERPACDLLEEPGTIDESTSLLAARLFHGEPAGSEPQWLPVDWEGYADEVVDRTWRTEAARLHRVLDGLGVPASEPGGATLARVLEHLAVPAGVPAAEPGGLPELTEAELATASDDELALRTGVDIGGEAAGRAATVPQPGGEVRRRVAERAEELAEALAAEVARDEARVPA
ncbi:membrane protein, partial [Streptomyces sp. NRRL F-6602]